MSYFAQYKRNIYSQNGQDGVIAELCRRLDITQGFFVDVGAWDGKQYSNTYALLRDGWHGVGIEGDDEKYSNLQQTAQEVGGRLQPVNAYVQAKGSNTLDELLQQTNAPARFDLLNVDVDSFDWGIWNGLENYQPKIVVIEINSSIPPSLPYVQAPDEYVGRTNNQGLAQGASVTSMLQRGSSKEYSLVAHVGDLFFVQNQLVPQLSMPDTELEHPEELYDDYFFVKKFITPRRIVRSLLLRSKVW